MKKVSAILLKAVSTATDSSSNETQLRHEIESHLKIACDELSIPWTPFQLDRALKQGKTTKFVDVAHGAVVIEYEPPKSFSGKVGAKLIHARQQAEEYAKLLSAEEGRALNEYVLVAWDGAHINFGRFDGENPVWESLLPCNQVSIERLLNELKQNGTPLVHPLLLAALVGPGTEHGIALIPKFFHSIISAWETGGSKTCLLFMEWSRLFGQVVGIQSDSLKDFLTKQEGSHGARYGENPAAFLFALNTYIALLAKLVAGCALPNASQDILDNSVPIKERMAELESGRLFEHAGIINMLNGDFFSWYIDDPSWLTFDNDLERLVMRLSGINYDISIKNPSTTRDLFKGIYQTFVPRELRHALGEFYTPDWLAEHGIDTVGWKPSDSMLDPTCGSGTFLIEALRRRLLSMKNPTAKSLLNGLFGIDLNPLAVLSAKASLAVFIAPYLDQQEPVRIPVFLADAINTASKEDDNCYVHHLQTEKGRISFKCPEPLVDSPLFHAVFSRLRELIDADICVGGITKAIYEEFGPFNLSEEDNERFTSTVASLVELHQQGWNGIWCPIIADRFSAGAIPPVQYICGNPPWVKWSHLPPEYANFIGPKCRSMGVFSSDKWVGGIESDISTVITFEAIRKYLLDGGRLGFFITGSVFTNESSEGFRQFSVADGKITGSVEVVEDYTPILPFEGVSNNPSFLVVRRGKQTTFPVTYRVWSAYDDQGKKIRQFSSAKEFKLLASAKNLLAQPVPGGGTTRPWIIGTDAEQKIFEKVFGASSQIYTARKGVTTDRNGIFWIELIQRNGSEVTIRNAATVGKTKGIPTKKAVVEDKHVFPLLRGRGVKPFSAIPDDLRIIVPQRGMHGDVDLPISAPKTAKYLAGFKSILNERSSYKRFQKKQGHPYYSLWSTGVYTFAPYKVLWREMGGNAFAAAYIGSVVDPILGLKIVIPDHKLYFIPVDTEGEAAYLTGFLNSPIISGAVSAYAAQLSLGASVAEYLIMPQFDKKDKLHKKIAALSKKITSRGDGPTTKEKMELDVCVKQMLGLN